MRLARLREVEKTYGGSAPALYRRGATPSCWPPSSGGRPPSDPARSVERARSPLSRPSSQCYTAGLGCGRRGRGRKARLADHGGAPLLPTRCSACRRGCAAPTSSLCLGHSCNERARIGRLGECPETGYRLGSDVHDNSCAKPIRSPRRIMVARVRGGLKPHNISHAPCFARLAESTRSRSLAQKKKAASHTHTPLRLRSPALPSVSKLVFPSLFGQRSLNSARCLELRVPETTTVVLRAASGGH